MTKTTDKRQLRLLVEGVLRAHGIDNLALEMKLTDCIKDFVDDESGLPVKTREAILKRLRESINIGQARHEQLEVIATEIEQRVHISPVSEQWQDFIKWVLDCEVPNGHTISKFLDWWLSDEWQVAHPPTSPISWRVKWPQAFIASTKPRRLSIPEQSS